MSPPGKRERVSKKELSKIYLRNICMVPIADDKSLSALVKVKAEVAMKKVKTRDSIISF